MIGKVFGHMMDMVLDGFSTVGKCCRMPPPEGMMIVDIFLLHMSTSEDPCVVDIKGNWDNAVVTPPA